MPGIVIAAETGHTNCHISIVNWNKL